METNELKPCPFCGGEARTATSTYRCGCRTVQIYCGDCGATIIGRYGLLSRHGYYLSNYKKLEFEVSEIAEPSPEEVYEKLKERWNTRYAENRV